MKCPKCGKQLKPINPAPYYGEAYCCKECKLIIIELKVDYG